MNGTGPSSAAASRESRIPAVSGRTSNLAIGKIGRWTRLKPTWLLLTALCSTPTLLAQNTAPVAAASTLTTIAEDVADANNPGTLVSALVSFIFLSFLPRLLTHFSMSCPPRGQGFVRGFAVGWGRARRGVAAGLLGVGLTVAVRAAAPVLSLEPSFTGAEDTPFLLAGSTFLVSTLAGSSTPGNADGTGAAAQFANLNGVAVDTAGNVYVSDSTNGNIRKITPAGVVTTLASVPTAFGVAVDAAGAVYTTGYNSNEIKKITSGVVTTLASGGDLNAPVGLAVDAAGNVYAAGHISHKVHKVTPAGVLTTFAGSTQGYLDGNGTAARLNTPRGVGVDAAGNVTVADTDNHRIRKITPAGVVTTLAGSGTPGFAEGTGAAAQFSAPYATAADAAGNVYVADSGNHRIRKISPAGVVTTLAGTGTQDRKSVV